MLKHSILICPFSKKMCAFCFGVYLGTFLGTLAAPRTLGGGSVDGSKGSSTVDVGSAWKGFDCDDSIARRWWIIKLLQGDLGEKVEIFEQIVEGCYDTTWIKYRRC